MPKKHRWTTLVVIFHCMPATESAVFLQMKTSEHNHALLNSGLFFFPQMSWIFACGLQFNSKSQPCIFFAGLLFIFKWNIHVCKKLGGAFCDLLLNKKQIKPFVFPNNENTEASHSRLLLVPQKSPLNFLHMFHSKIKHKPTKKHRHA